MEENQKNSKNNKKDWKKPELKRLDINLDTESSLGTGFDFVGRAS